VFVEQDKAQVRIYQRWSALNDGVICMKHAALDGVEVPVDQAFKFEGFSLKGPGDTSLGAPLAIESDCHCNLSFIAVHPDGRRQAMDLETPRMLSNPYRGRLNPTSLVTLNDRTRARIVLGDGHTYATMRQTTPSTIEIIVNRRVVARASATGEEVTSITIAQGYEAQGIEKLIRDSVRHSARREWLR